MEIPSGYIRCECCEGSGREECQNCGGAGQTARECDLGYEHEEECGDCDGAGDIDCYTCNGNGHVIDPDIEIDEGL